MFRYSFPAVLAVWSAFPAFAETCPASTADAARGIVISYDDGGASRTVLDPATGDTVEIATFADGYAFRSDLALGLVTMRLVDLDTGGAEIADTVGVYAYTPARPESIVPGTQWSARYTYVNAAETIEGSFLLSVWAETGVTIGGCTYRSYPVTTLGRDAEFTFLTQMDYLPDLGISILRGYGEPFSDTAVIQPLTIAIADKP